MVISSKKNNTSVSSPNGSVLKRNNPNIKPNIIKWVMIFFVLGIIGVLIWILTKSNKKGGSGSGGSGGSPCSSDSDCPEGNVCLHGDCVGKQGDNCESDSDCPTSQKCSKVTKRCVCPAGFGI